MRFCRGTSLRVLRRQVWLGKGGMRSEGKNKMQEAGCKK
jgi:hypothetical protein